MSSSSLSLCFQPVRWEMGGLAPWAWQGLMSYRGRSTGLEPGTGTCSVRVAAHSQPPTPPHPSSPAFPREGYRIGSHSSPWDLGRDVSGAQPCPSSHPPVPSPEGHSPPHPATSHSRGRKSAQKAGGRRPSSQGRNVDICPELMEALVLQEGHLPGSPGDTP